MRALRVLLLGSAGQLGRELAARFARMDITALDRSAANLSEPESLRAVVRATAPHVVLNAAAYTAVDRAEQEPALAEAVNHYAPAVLAQEAERLGGILVHYSTDYVFDGKKAGAWLETDPTGPLNVYGATKLAGEQAVLAACSRAVVLRTSWVYSAQGNNFLRTMLRLAETRPVLRVVKDQMGAPTSAAALAEASRAVVLAVSQQPDNAAAWAGVYHASCEGRTSWCGFAHAIFAAQAQRHPGFKSPRVEGISSAEYPTPARRPCNSELAHGKLWQRFSVRLPAWQTALEETLSSMPAALNA